MTFHGSVLAVLDISGPVASADPLLGIAVQSMAGAFEGLLRAREIENLAARVDTLRQQEAAVRGAHDELVSTLKLNETFVATLGHDLRNPIAAVLTGADLARARDRPRPSRGGRADPTSGRRMVRMINQLGDLARTRLGDGFSLDYQMVDLAAVAERAISEVQAVHPDRKIDLWKVGDSRGNWDAIRIEQVLSNLVGNAARHGTPLSPIRVTLDGSRTDAVVLSVTNAGEIDNSARPHLFKPFHSVRSERRSTEGLGLGLYIVEQVVRAHHGRIEVVTEHGRTEFRVILPRRRAAWSPAPDL